MTETKRRKEIEQVLIREGQDIYNARLKATQSLTLAELQAVTPEQIRALPQLIEALRAYQVMVDAFNSMLLHHDSREHIVDELDGLIDHAAMLMDNALAKAGAK